MAHMFKVLLVDDHPVMTDGLSFLLQREADLEVCGTAHTLQQARDFLDQQTPDLIVSDLTLPDGNGIDFVKSLRSRLPNLPILVLSMHDEILYAERALRVGARGYLMKATASTVVVDAIRTVLEGNLYFSEEIANKLLATSTGNASREASPLARLTDRQLQVFELIGQGKISTDIAKQLGVSSGTVDAHRWEIRQRLQLEDNAQLVRYAVSWTESDT